MLDDSNNITNGNNNMCLMIRAAWRDATYGSCIICYNMIP